MKWYEYRHIVSFQETNLVGNVYFAHYVAWQGKCREMFIYEHAPEVLQELMNGTLAMVTVHTACDYLAELVAFDKVIIRMRLGHMAQSRIAMLFEYWRETAQGEMLVARGEQQTACMRREGDGMIPVPIPAPLKTALQAYLP